MLEECEHSVSEPADLINLLQHHKNLGHFEQHGKQTSGHRLFNYFFFSSVKMKPCVGKPLFLSRVVPLSDMGDGILSTLSVVSSSRPMRSHPSQGSSDNPHIVSFVDDVAVEVITVTDYSEVELSTGTDKEGEEAAARGENSNRRSDSGSLAEETVAACPVEDGGGGEEATPSVTDVALPETSHEDLASPQHDVSLGPHDCPHCKKKFKFASSLTAHRVIHTGERPHCCGECGRRFSFRQSLDRHRHVHVHETGCELAKPRKTRAEEKDDDGNDGGDLIANTASGSHAEDREAACEACVGEVTRLHSDRASKRSEETAAAKVRTSGRKRRPTMKIQVLNLEKGAQRGKKSGKTGHLTLDW